MTVAKILEKKGFTIYTVRDNASLGRVIKELASKHIGALVVTNASGQMVGVLSERDVIRELANDERVSSKTAADVMTRTICKCGPEDTEGEIMERMGKASVRHLPVEHNGKLVGLVSARDILQFRIEQLEELMQEIRSEAAKL